MIDQQPTPDNFKDYPVGIKEHAAKTIDEWSPREALLATLRDIDNGEVKPENLFIGWSYEKADGKKGWGYSIAARNRFELVGALMHIINRFTSEE